MNEIEIKLTTQQTVDVLMAITNRMDNARNQKLAFSSSGESAARVEILDAEIQSLAGAYQAIQEALG